MRGGRGSDHLCPLGLDGSEGGSGKLYTLGAGVVGLMMSRTFNVHHYNEDDDRNSDHYDACINNDLNNSHINVKN